VEANAQQADDEDRKGQQQKAAYLATAFGLPAGCGRSGRLWH
jgi:hypothetical protein